MGKLSAAIVQRKLASLRDVEEALARQVLYGGDLATNLLEQAPRMDERALTELLAETYQLPAAPVAELARSSPETRSLVPGDVALRHGLYPLERSGNTLIVAVSEPIRPDVEQDLGFGLGLGIVQRVAPLVRVRQAISRDYGLPLDRRSQRILAKLEGKPDPSPSIAPLPLASAPDITSLPRPPSIPALGLPAPMDLSPLYGGVTGAPTYPASAFILKAPVTIQAPVIVAPVHPEVLLQEAPERESIHERLTSPAPPVAPNADEQTRPWPLTVEHSGTAASPVTAPTPPRDSPSTPPAPPAFLSGVADALPSTPPPPKAVSTAPPPRAASTAPPPPKTDSSVLPPPPTVTSGAATPANTGAVTPAPPVARRPGSGKYTIPVANLATWGAENKDAARRGRGRHRGPYATAAAEKDLFEAEGRDGVLTAFFDFTAQYFEYSALFAVHGDLAEGRNSYGPGADHSRITGIGVPLDMPGSLATARTEGRFSVVALAKDGLDARLAVDLQRRGGKKVLLLPLLVRGRCVLIFYGDHGTVDVDLSEIGDVIAFAPLVAAALENVILRKKTAVRQAVGEDGERPPASLRPSLRPRPILPSREERVDALAQALETTVRPVPSARPLQAPDQKTSETQPDLPTPGRPPPLPVPAGRARPMTPAQGTPVHASTPPPPPEGGTPVFKLSRRAEPTRRQSIPPDEGWDVQPRRSRASEDGPDIAIESEEVDWSPEDEEEVRGIPDSQVVVPAKLPVKAHSSAELRLPTVILNIDHDLDALVSRLLNGDDAAIDRLIRLGAPAASLLVSQFPGPILEDTDRLSAKELASQRGPVLKALARIGQPAVPFLAVRSNDEDPAIRAWATQLLGEIPSADTAQAVARRVTDTHAEVRQAAMDAGRLLQGDEDARTALRDKVLLIAEDAAASLEARVAALEALAHFRDGRAVPRLIRLVGTANDVGQSAQWALGLITRQAFGRDDDGWDAWWQTNGERHRLEWLIDALMHEDSEIRRAAGDELKTLTKEYFGYYDDLSKNERVKAQRRYREWWESTGKARFAG